MMGKTTSVNLYNRIKSKKRIETLEERSHSLEARVWKVEQKKVGWGIFALLFIILLSGIVWQGYQIQDTQKQLRAINGMVEWKCIQKVMVISGNGCEYRINENMNGGWFVFGGGSSGGAYTLSKKDVDEIVSNVTLKEICGA